MKAIVNIITEPNQLEGMVILQPTIFRDKRGENFEGFNEEEYFKILGTRFITDSFSVSTRDVLRGYHGDSISNKLISVLSGHVFFSALDMRPESSTYNQVFTTELSSASRKQIFIPKMILNAHKCLSNECIFSYKLSHGYVEPEYQLWQSPSRIKWPGGESIMSDRDSK